jgi:hypothetical protein
VFPAQLPVLPALRALQEANPQAYPPRDPEGQLDVAPEASGVHTAVQPKNMETKSSESGHEKGTESAAELEGECGERFCDMQNGDEMKVPTESVWVEGLVPGIDFCNHGCITGVPNSMYLMTGIFLSLFPPHVFSHGPTVGAGWVYSSLLRTMHH